MVDKFKYESVIQIFFQTFALKLNCFFSLIVFQLGAHKIWPAAQTEICQLSTWGTNGI